METHDGYRITVYAGKDIDRYAMPQGMFTPSTSDIAYRTLAYFFFNVGILVRMCFFNFRDEINSDSKKIERR